MANERFRKVRSVSLPQLKPELDREYYIRIDDAFSERDGKADKGGPASTMMITNITDMETGECFQLIATTIMVKELTMTYPENNYVGRIFEFIKHPIPAGKDYHPVTITEVIDTEAQAQ